MRKSSTAFVVMGVHMERIDVATGADPLSWTLFNV